MFEFLLDGFTYNDRKVARFDSDWGFISTARVSDGVRPYETAVKHTSYRDEGMIIVEAYDTKEEAEAGHQRWIATMTASELPEELKDVGNAHVAQLGEALFGPGSIAETYRRKDLR